MSDVEQSARAVPEPDLARLGAGLDLTDPHSPLAPYYCRTAQVVAALLLGLTFLFFSYVPLWHTDIWGHLKFGKWIVEHGRLPAREPFNPLSDPEAPALHAYWLGQVGLYLLYRAGELLAGGDGWQRMAGGVAVLRGLLALVLALRCGVLLAAFRRRGASLPFACIAVALMLAASIGHITVFRPQALAELFFACLLLAVARPVLSRRSLVVVPVLLAVWANVHGSYAGGLVLLAACAAGQLVTACRDRRSWNPAAALGCRAARRLLLALVLSAGAVALLNPHGPFIYWNTFLMGRSPNVASMEEWLPLSFARTEALVWLYVLSLALLAAAMLFSRRFYTPASLLVLVAFGVGPLLHVRMLIWWFMLVPWLLCPHWRAFRDRLPAGPALPPLPSLRKTVLAAVAVAVCVAWSSPAQWPLSGRPAPVEQAVFNATPWQVAAALQGAAGQPEPGLTALGRELSAHYPAGRFTGTVFASETQGDYLTWALAPEVPVLMYTHVHLFPPWAWRECEAVKFAVPGWRDVLDARGANLVVVEAEMYPALCDQLRQDRGWVTVLDEAGDAGKRDSRARLFIGLRKTPH